MENIEILKYLFKNYLDYEKIIGLKSLKENIENYKTIGIKEEIFDNYLKVKEMEEDKLKETGKNLYYKVLEDYEKISKYLKVGGLKHSPSGSFNRKKRLVGDLDIVVEGKAEKIFEYFDKYREIKEKIDDNGHYILNSGLEVEIIPEEEEYFNYTVWTSTGSKVHKNEIFGISKELGLSLKVPNITEKEVYNLLNLEYRRADKRCFSNLEYEKYNKKMKNIKENKVLAGIYTEYSIGELTFEEIYNFCFDNGIEKVILMDINFNLEKEDGYKNAIKNYNLKGKVQFLTAYEDYYSNGVVIPKADIKIGKVSENESVPKSENILKIIRKSVAGNLEENILLLNIDKNIVIENCFDLIETISKYNEIGCFKMICSYEELSDYKIERGFLEKLLFNE